MAIIPLYQDLLRVLQATPYGYPIWPVFEAEVYFPHRAYFEGLVATYGDAVFGSDGLRGALERAAPNLRECLRHSPTLGLEARARYWLEQVDPLLPWSAPNIYLGTLLFTGPAATLSVLGRPAIALGVERFHPTPPQTGPKYWYHPTETAEMIPHEAAHVARMQVLKLPPSPRSLSLLEMVMLEGTALVFTDQLLGRQTLTTFLPSERFAWHQANDAAIRAAVEPDFDKQGMEMFLKYFSTDSRVSGYYIGWSLCRDWLQRHGPDQLRHLITLPAKAIRAG